MIVGSARSDTTRVVKVNRHKMRPYCTVLYTSLHSRFESAFVTDVQPVGMPWCRTPSRAEPTKRWRSRYKLPGSGSLEGGPGRRLCCVMFLYHYLSTVQLNPLKPIRSHSVTERRSFRFGVNIVAGPRLLGKGPEKLFHWDRNPL